MIEVAGYSIIKPLGKGGMSTVYLAIQESVNRNVALKVMSPHLVSDDSYSVRFLREARIAANLTHPNIISILDVNMSNGLPYIAMEYAPGGELDSDRIASLDLKGKLRILVQVASALGFLHKQNFLHRDIKPSNILFREDDSVVLTDFGVAIDQASDNRVTLAGYIIGTPHYMSPEQAIGEELDARSDIYSLGVLVYRMLAGKVPFTGENAIAICHGHVHEKVPDLPPEFSMFDALVKKAMAKSPADRFGSATEFIDALVSATGQDTARMLRQSLSGSGIRSITGPSQSSSSRLEPVASISEGTRIQPTFGTASQSEKTVIAGLGPAPAVSQAEPDAPENIRDSHRFRMPKKHLAITIGSLAGIALLTVIVLFVSRSETADGESTSNEAILPETAVKADLQTDSTPSAPEQVELNTDAEIIAELLQSGRSVMADLRVLEPNDPSPSRLFRDVLIKDPFNAEALAALEQLANRLLDMADASIKAGDMASADRLLEEVRLTRSGDAERLVKLDQEFRQLGDRTAEQVRVVNRLLDEGNRYLAEDNLTRPEKDNALARFRQVLVLDPESRAAMDGVNRVAQRFLELATNDIDQGDWSKAESNWQSAFDIAPGLSGLALIRQKLDQYQSEQAPLPSVPATAVRSTTASGLPPAEIFPFQFGNLSLRGNESAATLFDMAESQLSSGNDLRAYGIYQQVIRKDSGHSAARKRLSRGAGVYLKFADRDISQGDLQSAYKNLQIALSLDADDPKADSTRRAYLTARESRTVHASQANNDSSDLKSLQINLLQQEAQSNHSRFRADPTNRMAATRAIDYYRQILSIQKSHSEANSGLTSLLSELITASQAAFDLKETSDAFWFYKTALEINPNDPRLTSLEAQMN